MFGKPISFVCGALGGVWVAQNYNIPNIKALAESMHVAALKYEATIRKN
jgi:hypothetical protein